MPRDEQYEAQTDPQSQAQERWVHSDPSGLCDPSSHTCMQTIKAVRQVVFILQLAG